MRVVLAVIFFEGPVGVGVGVGVVFLDAAQSCTKSVVSVVEKLIGSAICVVISIAHGVGIRQ